MLSMPVMKVSAKMKAHNSLKAKRPKPVTQVKYGRLPKTYTICFVTYDKSDGEIVVWKLSFDFHKKTFYLYNVGVVKDEKFIPNHDSSCDAEPKDIVYFQLKKGLFFLVCCDHGKHRRYQAFMDTPQIVKYFTKLSDAKLFALHFSKPSNKEGQEFEDGRWTILWSFASWYPNRVFLNKKDIRKRKGHRVKI